MGRTVIFAVTLERGGPWDWSRGLREQDGFDEHARFMGALVDEHFILLDCLGATQARA